jgi:hypothetical protein
MDGEWPDGGDDTRTLGRPARMTAHQDAQDANLTPPPAGVASVPTVDAAAVPATHRRTTLRHVVWEDADGLLRRGLRQFAESVCERCGQPWRGDAETGGCEAVLLARRVALLEGLLREVQQHAHWGTCSVCGWHRDHGHRPDCRLAAALADGG